MVKQTLIPGAAPTVGIFNRRQSSRVKLLWSGPGVGFHGQIDFNEKVNKSKWGRQMHVIRHLVSEIEMAHLRRNLTD